MRVCQLTVCFSHYFKCALEAFVYVVAVMPSLECLLIISYNVLLNLGFYSVIEIMVAKYYISQLDLSELFLTFRCRL